MFFRKNRYNIILNTPLDKHRGFRADLVIKLRATKGIPLVAARDLVVSICPVLPMLTTKGHAKSIVEYLNLEGIDCKLILIK